MSDNTLEEIRSLEHGGVWNTDKLIPDDSWTGEVSTLEASKDQNTKVLTPKTPAQEDKETLSSLIGNPTVISALTREIERCMLRVSGRSVHTSVVQQMTDERELMEKRIRDWIITQRQTESVKLSDESKSLASRMNAIDEKLATLENRLTELMTTNATHLEAERELIQDAANIVRSRREEEIGSNQTPSEVSRMERRAEQLNEEIMKLRSSPEVTIARVGFKSTVATNKSKFGKLF